MYVDNTSVG